MLTFYLIFFLLSSVLGCPTFNSYDYIVVGAGSAGCVVANRLAKSGASVLLLESGTDPGALNDIPALSLFLNRPPFARIIRSQPSPNFCLSNTERCLSLVIGNATGGGSAINGMAYTRGTAQDFDEWAGDHGAVGWSYRDLAPIFRSLERYDGPESNPAYGTQGERYLNYPNATFSLADQPFREAGNNLTKDYDELLGVVNIGFTKFLLTVLRGVRQDAYDAFIRPLQMTKLHVVTGAFVTKVNFRGRRADRVEYTWGHSQRCKTRARREIILSAGAIMTPHLLMHSGIGPRSVLKPLGIPVIADLPVGQNLQNHVSTAALNFSLDQNYVNENRPFVSFDTEFIKYIYTQEGIFTLPNLATSLGFINTTSRLTEPPNVELELGPTAIYNAFVGDNTGFPTGPAGPGDGGFGMLVTLMKPYSRGNLFINSTDPYQNPIVNLNYFDDPRDMKNIVAGMRFSLELVRQPPMQAIGATLTVRPVEGCDGLEEWSDQHLECLARHNTFSSLHYAGTCKMGSKSSNAVVDPRLRVYGVRGLRVMDASIMPTVITGHPMAICHVIGAKGAAMVLQDHPY